MKTLQNGEREFEKVANRTKNAGKTVLDTNAVFNLYETYGFPPEMTEELEARFNWADENQIDSYDFYSDLLEIGIDVDMVRRYLGEKRAIHMEWFCREYKLI